MTSFVCYGQFLASFSATSSEYTATIGGSHSLQEPMFVTSFALRWLKRSFHCLIALCPVIAGEFIIIVLSYFSVRKRATPYISKDYTAFVTEKACKGTSFFLHDKIIRLEK